MQDAPLPVVKKWLIYITPLLRGEFTPCYPFIFGQFTGGYIYIYYSIYKADPMGPILLGKNTVHGTLGSVDDLGLDHVPWAGKELEVFFCFEKSANFFCKV